MTDDEPIPLAEACDLYPRAKLTVSTLRAEEERRKRRERMRRWRAKPSSKAKETKNRKKWRTKHKDKDKASRLRWRKNNPLKRRAQNRRRAIRKYGLTPELYDRLFSSQGFACGICGSKEPGGKFDWAIDHCHEQNIVRGILCHHCNRIVHYRATAQVLRRAADYIELALGNAKWIGTAQ